MNRSKNLNLGKTLKGSSFDAIKLEVDKVLSASMLYGY